MISSRDLYIEGVLVLAAFLAAVVGALVLAIGAFARLPFEVEIAAAIAVGLGVVTIAVDAYVASRATHVPWYRSLWQSLREVGELLRHLLV